MKQFLISTAVIAALLTSSCKKEEPVQPTTVAVKQTTTPIALIGSKWNVWKTDITDSVGVLIQSQPGNGTTQQYSTDSLYEVSGTVKNVFAVKYNPGSVTVHYATANDVVWFIETANNEQEYKLTREKQHGKTGLIYYLKK